MIAFPFTRFDVVSLSIFSIFYGLDWIATCPATFALTNELFGPRDTPVIVLWILADHQAGGAIAAFGAGTVRSLVTTAGVPDRRPCLLLRLAAGAARHPRRARLAPAMGWRRAITI